MKRYKFFIIIVISFNLLSCVSNKYLKLVKSEKKYPKLNYFDSFATIQIVERTNKFYYNDSLIKRFSLKLDSIIDANKENYRINNKIKISNDKLRDSINREISSLYYNLTSPLFGANKIKIPKVIDSLLESRNQRFAIVVKGFGYIYNKENTILKKVKGRLVNLATIGFAGTPPIKNELSLSFLIIDSKKDEIAAYIGLPPVYKNPMDEVATKANLDNLFIGNIVDKKLQY